MTSLPVFLTLLILFIFGGEVTRGFAFAMLIGVVTGTYSSIFVAAPILVDFAKDKPLGEAELINSDKSKAKALAKATAQKAQIIFMCKDMELDKCLVQYELKRI